MLVSEHTEHSKVHFQNILFESLEININQKLGGDRCLLKTHI